MNKSLKILLINIIFLISFIINSQNNVSYSQNIHSLDDLISTSKREVYLEKRVNDLNYILNTKKKYDKYNSTLLIKKISVDSLKYTQINLLKNFLNKQLVNCKQTKKYLISEIKSERQEIISENNSQYIKGEWPLKNYYYISSGYGYRTHPISKKLTFHHGIDIPAPKNTDVLASDDGIVVFAGYKRGYGNVVEIEHFDSKSTLYAHNNSINVKVGDIVKKGEVISKVGSTGNSTGNHVHFEVKINNERINPIYGVSKE